MLENRSHLSLNQEGQDEVDIVDVSPMKNSG